MARKGWRGLQYKRPYEAGVVVRCYVSRVAWVKGKRGVVQYVCRAHMPKKMKMKRKGRLRWRLQNDLCQCLKIVGNEKGVIVFGDMDVNASS